MTTSAEFWDGIADGYAKKPLDNPDAYRRKLALLEPRLRTHHRVLDIGCGTGSLALELAPLVAHVHSVDISPKMVEIGRRKVADAGVHNVTFHVGDFDRLDFEPGSFDVLCAFNILHLLPDPAASMFNLASLAKPGAPFVSSTACLRESWVPYRPIIGVMRLLGKAPNVVKHLSIADLERSMRAAGFESLERPDVGAAKDHAFIIARRAGD